MPEEALRLPVRKVIDFDASYVIGLPRVGRLETFHRTFPLDWPIPVPQLFHGIDAARVPVPRWWTELPGMWGCNESHKAVLANALSLGYRTVAIFEDDCRFIPNSAAAVRAFLHNVPDDWDALMFGGQVSVFDGKTTPVAPGISRCVQVERLHAYALTRKGMETFYAALCEAGDCKPNDYRWGDLQERGKLITYRCEPFLCYQADGPSSISERVEPSRAWDERVDVRVRRPEDVPIVSLVCPFEVMDRLRREGLISNGGETPPQYATIELGRVEAGERGIACALLNATLNHPELARHVVKNLRGDAAFHRNGPLALWHPMTLIPFDGSIPIEAITYEQARECIEAVTEAAEAPAVRVRVE